MIENPVERQYIMFAQIKNVLPNRQVNDD